MVGAVPTPKSPSPVQHAFKSRAAIQRLPRSLDLLGALPNRSVQDLAQARVGGKVNLLA